MVTSLLASNKTIFVISLFVILPVYIICTTPSHTWISAGVDHFDFIYAANNWYQAHATGFPTYIIPASILVHLFPNENPAWLLALSLSTIPTVLTIIFSFHITAELAKKHIENPKKRLVAPYVTALSIACAQPILAQTFIVEVYTFAMMWCTATILAHVKGKHNLAALLMAFAVGSHGLMLTLFGLFGLLNFKTYVKRLWIIIPVGLLLYSYVFLIYGRQEGIFLTKPLGNHFWDWKEYFSEGSAIYWWGTLPVDQIFIRIFDTTVLLVTGFSVAILGLILSIRYDIKKFAWIWIITAPILIYWITVVTPIIHVHFALIIPFLAILAGLGLKHLHPKIQPQLLLLPYPILIALIPLTWDIGRTVDKDMDAHVFRNEILPELSQTERKNIFFNLTLLNQDYKYDGRIVDGTAIWWAILDFKAETKDTNIIPIIPHRYTLTNKKLGNIEEPAAKYRELLRSLDINTPYTTIQWNDDENYWYINWNNDPNNHLILSRENRWVTERYQLHLWLTLDLVAAANPDKNIWIMERTGQKETITKPIQFTRDLIPTNIRTELDEIYIKASNF